jgi:hypothetical protein
VEDGSASRKEKVVPSVDAEVEINGNFSHSAYRVWELPVPEVRISGGGPPPPPPPPAPGAKRKR